MRRTIRKRHTDMNARSLNPEDASVPLGADVVVTGELRKRWLYLLPTIFVTYSLAYLDRANFGFGAAADHVAVTGRLESARQRIGKAE